MQMKEQTVVAFLDVSGAYDNVLVDVLCSVTLDKELPVGLARFLRNLLWCKTLVFNIGGVKCMILTGYKGLPHGSVLSPLLYNLLGSGMDRLIPLGCIFLQYADKIVVYSSHHIFKIARTLVQTACSSLSVFFSMIGLTISATKSEVVLFSLKHLQPVVSIRVNGRLLVDGFLVVE
jgi:hypothetical protein